MIYSILPIDFKYFGTYFNHVLIIFFVIYYHFIVKVQKMDTDTKT